MVRIVAGARAHFVESLAKELIIREKWRSVKVCSNAQPQPDDRA